MTDAGHVEELQRVLMEEEDASTRARAHMDLARLAVTAGEPERAARHLKEALELDPRLKRARERLHDVEQLSEAVRVRVRGRRQKVTRLLRRLAKRDREE